MADIWDEKAEALLTRFPDNWSPSCKLVTDAVGTELRKMGAEIEQLEKFYEHDHQLCIDQASIVIEANTEVNQFRTEIERLKALWIDRESLWHEAERKIDRLNNKLSCGHRKLDWDDGYSECVACKIKQAADDYDRLPHDVIACHDRIEELEAERDAAYLEIAQLKLDDLLRAPFRCTDCDYKTNVEVNLEAHCGLHTAYQEVERIKTVDFPHKVEVVAQANYLKGLEECFEIVDGHDRRIAVRMIQSRIDEVKSK